MTINYIPFVRHYNPLLIRNRSRILTIHKDRIVWKEKFLENKEMVFQNGVKSIQAAACNGAHGIGQQIFVLFSSLDKVFRNIIDHNAYNFHYKFKWVFKIFSTKIEFRWFPSNVGFLHPFCWFQFEPRNGLIWVRKCPRFDWQLFWLEFSTPKFQRLVLLDSISNLRQNFCSLTFLWWICEANFIWLYLSCAPVAV